MEVAHLAVSLRKGRSRAMVDFSSAQGLMPELPQIPDRKRVNMSFISMYIIITNAEFKGEIWDSLVFNPNLEVPKSKS